MPAPDVSSRSYQFQLGVRSRSSVPYRVQSVSEQSQQEETQDLAPGGGDRAQAHSGAPSTNPQATNPQAELMFMVLAFGLGVFLATELKGQVTWKSGAPLVKQPGFFSLVAISGMLLFGLFSLGFSVRNLIVSRRAEGTSLASELWFWMRSLEFALWFMGYVFAVGVAGYLPSTLVFCVALTIRLGYHNRRYVLAATLVGLVTVVVFKSFLAVKIPGGAWYEHLPDAVRNFFLLYL